jgi:hypothetical protein
MDFSKPNRILVSRIKQLEVDWEAREHEGERKVEQIRAAAGYGRGQKLLAHWGLEDD